MRTQRTGFKRQGFTLVELLVVIGIIALLISILLPALNKAREQGKATQCLSNLRQLSIGMQLYRAANRDCFPPRSLKIQDQVGLAPEKYMSSVYMWAGKGADPKKKYDQNYVDASTDKRYINRYISPKIRAGDEFPLARCPSDDEAYDGYGSSYTGNYFSGKNASPQFFNLIDPDDPGLDPLNTAAYAKGPLRGVRGSSIRSAATFIVAGENSGVSIAYDDTSNVQNYQLFHYKDKYQNSGKAGNETRTKGKWNMMFADGHCAPVEMTRRPAGSKLPASGPDWTLYFKTR